MNQKNRDTIARKYQKQFWTTAFLQLPHHTLLLSSVRLGASPIVRLLSKKSETYLKQFSLKTYSTKEVKQYVDRATLAKLWHGTGKLQYHNEDLVDTFEAIVKSGSLNPAKDTYAILIGGAEMVSISTTPLRIIARSYADTHGKGEKELYRYGSSLWWVAYYYSIFYGEIFTKHGIKVLKNWSKWDKSSANRTGERLWGRKVNRKAISVWDVFGSGSDIRNNYPILFGISKYTNVAVVPKTIAKTEVRLTHTVKLSQLSHIEVPETRVHEVASFLAEYGYSIKVFPIELGEFVSSKQSFGELLGYSK